MIFATYKSDPPINERSSRHTIDSTLINRLFPLDFILLRLKPLTTENQQNFENLIACFLLNCPNEGPQIFSLIVVQQRLPLRMPSNLRSIFENLFTEQCNDRISLD